MQFLRRPVTAALVALSLALAAQALAKPGLAGPGAADEPWWKHAVIYEIYPRSFQDSNGDGIGDLNGITRRLDYLQSLKVDAIWLTPIYPSPQVDFGYDISDYTAIDPQYGTLEDFDRLVREAKRRNIRIMMDMVLNHTSDRHPWFVESAGNKSNPKRDWYLWRDGKGVQNGKALPPNNWQSLFGHSAWQYDEKTKQFYYHYFYAQQPDLNWRNPAVESAMFDAVRFWLDRGVAGFRLDAITNLFEVSDLRAARLLGGINAYGDPITDWSVQNDQPEVHDVMRDLRKVIDAAPGQRLLVGEIYTDTTAGLNTWYGANHDELQLPMDTQVGFIDKLDVTAFRTRLADAQTKLSGNTPLLVFDNHDNARSWDRYGDGKHNEDIAKVLATILLANRDAALMYYGQELGMTTSTPTRKEDVKDPIGITGWPQNKGRDGERTPMQWDATKNAGFSEAEKTWLPVPGSSIATNVEAEMKASHSLLHWYQRLIAPRHTNLALRSGSTVLLDHDADNALVWLRIPQNATPAGPAVAVVCNFSAQPITLSLQDDLEKQSIRGTFLRTVLRSDNATSSMKLNGVRLPPYGVYMGEIH